MINEKTIIILAPHTDDGELGCGGTIAKKKDEGFNLVYIAFSSCQESLPENLAKNTLKLEASNALSKLGLAKENFICKDFPVRKFSEHRQEILEFLVEIEKKLRPCIVYLPSTYDTHQDHNVVRNEGYRAFKKNTIYGYELPWNNIKFSTDIFSVLSEKNIKTKIKSLQCYKSQKDRPYFDKSYMLSLAKVRGTQIGLKYAETFELIRFVEH